MRVAAIYDIHANLPALEAVLQDVRQAKVDQVVVGGDVLPGPMPNETIECLLNLHIPVQFIQGNGDRVVLAQMRHGVERRPREISRGRALGGAAASSRARALVSGLAKNMPCRGSRLRRGVVLPCHTAKRH
jgi:Calcineurin-like phosphoesterase superfamily domain